MGTITQNLEKLVAAKSAIATAITAKGGTVASGDGFEEFAADIATIPAVQPGPQIVLKILNNSNWDSSWQTLEDMFEGLGIILYTKEGMKKKTLEPANAARWVIYNVSPGSDESGTSDTAMIASYKAAGTYSYTLTGPFSDIYSQITKNKDFWYFAYE